MSFSNDNLAFEDLNTVQIDVIDAKTLKEDPAKVLNGVYVKLAIGNRTFRTRQEKGTSAAHVNWDQRVHVPVKRGSTAVGNLELTVYDQELLTKVFLGKVVIPGTQIMQAKKDQERNHVSARSEWYQLLTKNLGHDRSLGEIRIAIRWCHVEGAKVSKRTELLSKIGLKRNKNAENISVRDSCSDLDNAEFPELEDEMMEGEDGQEVDTDSEAENEENMEAQKLLLEDMVDNARRLEIKPGDWRVIIHVIEVRELHPEDLQGTCDPVCQMEVSSPSFKTIKRNTRIKKSVRSCVFDETFFFDLKQVDREALEATEIRFAVFDADKFSRNDLIGAYTFDCLTVYYGSKNHSVHEAWVGLIDDRNAADKGLQGYAKVSVHVLGPGDVYKEDGDQGESPEATGTSGEELMNVLMPPNIEQKLNFLRVKLYQARDLPNLDQSFLNKGGIDAFVRVRFNGNPKCTSKIITVKKKTANRELKAVYNEEMWLPVFLQNGTHTLAKNIMIQLWDHDKTSRNDLVSTLNLDFQEVLKQTLRWPRGVIPPRWYHLYGAPVYSDTSIIHQVDQSVCNKMNRLPSQASAYRGCVLLGLNTSEFEEGQPETVHKKVLRSIKRSQLPSTTRYILRFWAIGGSEVPSLKTLGNATKLAIPTLFLSMSIGMHSLTSTGKTPSKGSIRWGEAYEQDVIFPKELEDRWRSDIVQNRVEEYDELLGELEALKNRMPQVLINAKESLSPETVETLAETNPLRELIDLESQIKALRTQILSLAGNSQVPDIFVYLSTKKRNVAFARFRPEELLLDRFRAPARWIPLAEDKATNLLDDDDYPGSVLVRMGFGGVAEASATESLWDARELERMRTTHKYHVRVHLFKGSDLSAADSDGLSDPYCKVHLVGQKKKSKRQDNTCDPDFYETLTFDLELPPPQYAPYVSIYIYDYDKFGGDDRLGSLRIPLTRTSIEPGQDRLVYQQKINPAWYSVTQDGDEKQTKCGSLLVATQVFRTEPGDPPLPDLESLIPESTPASVEFVILGLRQLQSYKGIPIQYPLVEAHMGQSSKTKVHLTKRSKKPDGVNPNFGERLVIPFNMPKNPVFMPKLHVRVLDSRFGGLVSPCVATCSIDLLSKIPTSESESPSNRDELARCMSSSKNEVITRRDSRASSHPHVHSPIHAGRPEEEDADNNLDMYETGTVFEDDLEEQEDDLEDGEMEGAEGGSIAQQGPGASPLRDFESDIKHIVSQERVRLDSSENMPLVDTAPSPNHASGKKKFRVRSSKKRKAGYEELTDDQGDVDAERQSETIDEDSDTSDDDDVLGLDEFETWQNHDPLPLPKWMKGRPEYSQELEFEIGKSPFESFALHRGQKTGRSVFGFKLKSNFRKVGVLKGTVNVIFPGMRSPLSDEFLKRLMIPRPVEIRVNVLKGFNFLPLDIGGGKSDPYLKLRLGKQKLNDRKRYIDNAVNPEFYRRFELQTTLPGASQLEIKAFDYDTFSSDDLIGETVIDLEDRWFNDHWQQLSTVEEAPAEDGQTTNAQEQPVPYFRKPTEVRSLWTPTSLSEQGKLEMWVDIMDQLTSMKYPAVDVSPPANMEYEMRVVIWKTANIPNFDYFTDQNDLFVRVGFNEKFKETDTHWRCKKGKGSFNYRIKFPVHLPLESLKSRLTVQVWDRDVVKWSDCIAEAIIDLDKHFKAAFVQADERYQVYDDERLKTRLLEKEAARKEKELAAAQALAEESTGTASTMDPNQTGMPQRADSRASGSQLGRELGSRLGRESESESQGDQSADGGKGDGLESRPEESPEDGIELVEVHVQPDQDQSMMERQDSVDEALSIVIDQPQEGLDDMSSLARVDSTGSRTGKSELSRRTKTSKKKKKKSATVAPEATEKRDAAKELVRNYMPWAVDVFGTDAHMVNARAIPLFKVDDGVAKSMGEVYVSVELVRTDVADIKFNNGKGRSDPNQYPVLPKPTGRLKFSMFWNPFYVLEECLGPRLCRQCVCVCICLIMIPIVVFVVPNIADMVQMFNSMPYPIPYVLLGTAVGLFVFLCCYCYCYNKFREADCCKRNSPARVEEMDPLLV